MNNPETKQAAERLREVEPSQFLSGYGKPNVCIVVERDLHTVLDALAARETELADAQRQGQADAARLARLENFIAWMRRRVDEVNKFNTHTTLTMFLRRLDELPAAADGLAADGRATEGAP